MATNDIKFKVVATADGFNIVQKKQKGLADQIDRTTKSTKNLTKSQNDNYGRQKQGLIQTANGTKNFSKLSQTIGSGSSGLVGAYATLAANVFAASAAFNALRQAAAFSQLTEGFTFMANEAGRTTSVVVDRLKEITGQALSTREALESASLALSAGFKTDELETLAKVARGASLALGRNLNDAFDRLTRGAIKLEPEILDELGIMVRLDDAVDKYAASLGKSAKSLTQFERQQAFLNAINEQGIQKYGAIADAIDVNPYDRLSAAFEDLTKAGFETINVVLIPLVEIFAGSKGAMIGGLVLFGSTIVTQMIPALGNMAQRAKQAADDNLELATSLKASSDAGAIEGRDAIARAKGGSKAFKDYKKDVIAGTATQKQHTHQVMLSEKRLATARNSRTTLEKNEANLDAARHAEKMRRLDARIAKEIQLTQAIRSQIGVGPPTQGFIQAEAESNIANQRSVGLTAIGAAGGPIAGFKEARFQMKEFRKSADFTNAKTKIMGINFKGAAGSIRLAGTAMSFYGSALLNAIPFIGQAIFFGSILFGILSKLRTTAEDLNPSLGALAEISETMSDKFDQLNRTMQTTDTALGNIAAYKTTAGILGEINTELKISAKTTESIIKRKKEERQAQRELFAETLRSKGFDPDRSLMAFDNETANQFQNELLKTERKLKKAEETAAKDALKKAFTDSSPASDLLRKSLLAQADALGIVIDKNGKTKASLEELRDLFKNTDGVISPINDNLQSLEKQLTSVEKEFANFFQKSKAKTEYDQIRDNFVSLSETIKTLQAEGKDDEVQKLLEKSGKQLNRFGDDCKSAERNVHEIAKALEELVQKSIISQEKIKKLSGSIKLFNKLTKGNPALVKKVIALENERTNTTKELLEAELSILDTNTKDKEVLAKIKDLRAKISVESRKLITTEEARLMVLQQEIALASDLLKIKQATEKATRSLLESEAKYQQFVATGSLDTDPVKALKLAQDKGRADVQAIKDKGAAEASAQRTLINLQVERIRKEHEVVLEGNKAAQTYFEVEMKKIKAIEERTAAEVASAEAVNKLLAPQAFVDAINNNDIIAAAGAFSLLDKGAQTTGNAFAIAKISIDGMAESIGKLNEGFGQSISLFARLAEQMLNMTDTVSKLKDMLDSQGEGVFGSISNENAAKAIAGLMAVSTAISAFGAAQQGLAQSRIAEVDRAIEMEKKLDGRSAQSVAKMKALEDKKLALKKKAFEQNKKIQIATAVISTAVAAALTFAALAGIPIVGPALAVAAAAAIVAMGMAQVNMIKKTTFQGGNDSVTAGNSSINVGGQRNNRVDVSQGASAGETAYLRGGSGVGSNANSFTPGGAMGRKGYADGGMLVGERGPEVVTKEEIIPNYALGGNKSMNLTFNVNAVDSQSVQELLTNNQGAVVGAIRDAANSYGQDFLPDVNVGYEGGG